MSQLWATGPSGIFVTLNGTPTFLGHSERTPSISIRSQFTDAWSDLGGQSIPTDKMFEGADAMVTFDLTRFNYPVFQSVADRAAPGGPPPAGSLFSGSFAPGEIGSLMQAEGLAPPIWLTFPYSAKAAYGGGATLPAGMRFLSAFLLGPEDYTVGTVPHKIHCIFYCMRALNITTQNNFGSGQWTLFDYNTAGLPAIN
jgi:hypothetical protein